MRIELGFFLENTWNPYKQWNLNMNKIDHLAEDQIILFLVLVDEWKGNVTLVIELICM